jgi:hypothetical protein
MNYSVERGRDLSSTCSRGRAEMADTAVVGALARIEPPSCAFLGTSVITKSSIISESTARENVDLTDRNFLIIRVILGTLFAVLLGLPFSPLGLNVFIPLYWNHEIFPSQSNLVFSLIPFLAGFSTNLVLVILGKFVVAIEAVFGLSGHT